MAETALQLIAEAKKEKATVLDLGNCGLTELPEELFELWWLEELYVCNEYWDLRKQKWIKSKNNGKPNRLNKMPAGIQNLKQIKKLFIRNDFPNEWITSDISILTQLPSLTSLDLSFTGISDFSVLKQLPSLTYLNLNHNKISDISVLEQLPSLTYLSLEYNKISDISVLAQLPSLTALYISINQISDISILAQLPLLTSLYLGYNIISDISVLAQLPLLTSLYLGYNQISDLSVFAELPLLTSLNLSHNKISDLSVLELLPSLTSLNLGYNMISDISVLEHLTSLTSLDLSFNKISDFSILAQLTSLTFLGLSNNNIIDISVLEHLTSLTSLDLSFNKISDISILAQLTLLTSLGLSENNISDFSVLTQLTSLTSLDLSENKISDFSVLTQLTSLTSLNLKGNNFSNFSVLEHLTSLTYLDLSNNKISDISVLEHLTSLTKLYLSRNNIIDISVLAQLTSLTYLDLSNNKISDISVLAQLTSLTYLDLSNNKICDISVLVQLTSLTYLNLKNTGISDISDLEHLSSLTSLNLSNNEISTLPSWFVKRKFRITIDDYIGGNNCTIHNNPITYPPIEIIEKGHDAIVRFFEETEDKGTDRLYEAKLLLVGEGGVGKTSFRLRFMNPKAKLPEKDERTRGIDIEKYLFTGRDNMQFRINIWDFGGQDIYHATHRFFLTHSSLYVLMTETRRQDDNFDYWIPNIQLFAGSSPVLVVKNLIDGVQRNISIGHFKKNESFNIKDSVFTVNLSDNTGLPQLKEAVLFHIQQLKHVGQAIPRTWVRVRKKIKKLAKKKHYISFETFEGVCRKNDITEKKKIDDLGAYFHDLGIVLWYYSIPVLKSKVILRPHWVTNAMYLIIDDLTIQQNHGIFTKKDAQRIWHEPEYRNMHDELLELMKAFKLCYRKKSGDAFIIPSLLEPDPPSEYHWDTAGNLRVRFSYEFMPKGIVNQLTAEMSGYIVNDDTVWSRGVILQDDEGNRAKVEEDRLKRLVRINTQGIDSGGFLAILMKELKDIHDTYPGIKATRQVPCQCDACRNNPDPTIFAYDKLITYLGEGKKEVYCNDGGQFLDIKKILYNIGITGNNEDPSRSSGYEDKRYMQKQGREDKPLKVFISYSKYDTTDAETLLKYLKPLEKQRLIQRWYDRMIKPGDEWDEKIKRKILESDIILFMVSQDFLSTDYITDNEIPLALKKHEQGTAAVIPIILRPCTWEKDFPEVSRLLALPDKAKPLSQWNKDEAWVAVLDGIRKVIEERA